MSGTLDHWGGGPFCIAGPGPAVLRGGSRDLGSGESEGLGPPRAVLGPGDVSRQGVECGTGLQPVGTCQSVDRDPVGGVTASRAQYRLRPVQGSLVRACRASQCLVCFSRRSTSFKGVRRPSGKVGLRSSRSLLPTSEQSARSRVHPSPCRASFPLDAVCVCLCVPSHNGGRNPSV